MKRFRFRVPTIVTLALLAGTPVVRAQAQAAPIQGEAFRSAQGEHKPSEREVNIMGHLANSHVVEIPWFNKRYTKEIELPRWTPIRVGGIDIDLSPTKHSVYVVLAAILVAAVFLLTARSIARSHAEGRPPQGFANAMEATALYIRQEVILPSVGPHGEGYVPYVLTTFFFVLACNLLGLVPWGAAATGNIAVTGALAVLAFVVIEISGMRALGFKGYMGTIFYLPPGLPTVLKPFMLLVMTPIELIGKVAKPFALAVRLFANMTAGHALVLALIGLTFTFGSYLVGGVASLMSVCIMLLELFVAFLQAYVFALLVAVFIGLMRAEHH
jgi:F-type H+-transporting ATPase subunit a